MQTIEINANNFLAGASTNNFFADAGYSPLSKGINHIYEKGVLHWQPKINAITYTGGAVVAAVNNEVNASPFPLAFFIDDEKKFSTLNADFSTTVHHTDATSNTYTYGQTNAVFFGLSIYITSQRDIIKWDAQTPAIIDFDYWTATLGNSALNSGVHHPMQVIEDTLYIGNINFIHTIDSTGADVSNAMTLPSCEITAFAAHPNGRDLIVFATKEGNDGNVKQVKNIAYIVNTITLEFSQEILLDDRVASARTVGGITYVTYGTKLGYFTDTGIVFLRQLETTYGSDSNFSFPARVGNFTGTYLVAEGSSVLAIGDLGAGKALYYPLEDTSNTDSNIGFILPIGQDRLFYGKGDSLLYYVDYKTDADNANSTLFYTNKINIPARAWIRRIEIEHTPFVTGVGLKLYSVDESDALTDMGTLSYATSSTAKRSRWDMNVYTSIAQFAVQAIKTAGSPIGIRKMIIYYEIGDEI